MSWPTPPAASRLWWSPLLGGPVACGRGAPREARSTPCQPRSPSQRRAPTRARCSWRVHGFAGLASPSSAASPFSPLPKSLSLLAFSPAAGLGQSSRVPTLVTAAVPITAASTAPARALRALRSALTSARPTIGASISVNELHIPATACHAQHGHCRVRTDYCHRRCLAWPCKEGLAGQALRSLEP